MLLLLKVFGVYVSFLFSVKRSEAVRHNVPSQAVRAVRVFENERAILTSYNAHANSANTAVLVLLNILCPLSSSPSFTGASIPLRRLPLRHPAYPRLYVISILPHPPARDVCSAVFSRWPWRNSHLRCYLRPRRVPLSDGHLPAAPEDRTRETGCRLSIRLGRVTGRLSLKS